MVSSMTAFSGKRVHTEQGEVYWELRSVNHRFLDITFKLPEALKGLEPDCRALLRKRLKRGKVECSLKYKPVEMDDLNVNHSLVRAIVNTVSDLQSKTKHIRDINPMPLLAWPGVIEEQTVEHCVVAPGLLTHLSAVVDDFISMREVEGSALRQLLEERMESIRQAVALVQSRYPLVMKAYQERLRKRLQEVKQEVEVDEHRLAQEMIYVSQKYDVEEELDRLLTHVDEVEKSLNAGGCIGRKLDFLMQELHREANTLASKSLDVQITQIAVDLKVAIEQMREQVQNIE